ncbi:MAG: sn-glycerol-1-phosphate dehydrogenase, partial [Clostridia bacterium]|nr:sn-glycerol-1-phosphate dehydrogenase [Clostridia bacterium]
SHIWDMRKASFGTYINLHGIQCAVGTYISARIYEKLLSVTPDKKKALDFVASFDYGKRAELLTGLLGKGAKSMIDLEAKEGKFDKEKHALRLEKITDGWDEITDIIKSEIPTVEFLDKLYDTVGLPKTPGEAGIDDALLPVTVKVAGDIRDKYVVSRLLWGLGIADEIADNL